MRKMNESEMRAVDGGRARIVGWKRAPIGWYYYWRDGGHRWTTWALVGPAQ